MYVFLFDGIRDATTAAFKNVGLIGRNQENVIWPERMHGVFRYKCAFTPYDPNQLGFFMAMQVGIELWNDIFLHGHGFIGHDWDGELKCFHIPMK